MAETQAVPLERFPTCVPGLDDVTEGGLFRGGIYLVAGPPGSGKTVLASQMGFGVAARGEQVIYITLLTENHARMLANLRTLGFFEASLTGSRITFLSGYSALAQDGLAALLTLVRDEVHRRSATFLVIDGLSLAESFATSEVEFKRFIHDLQVIGISFGCTALLLTDWAPDGPHPQEALVEGKIVLREVTVGLRTVRQLRIAKLRGTSHLTGFHYFTLTAAGITVYPRLEAMVAGQTMTPREPGPRVETGIPDLDAMLGGGLPAESTTLVLGASGSGKTLLALHMLTQAAATGRRGLYYGFAEMAPALVHKAESAGLDLRPHLESSSVQIRWRVPVEGSLDVFAAAVLEDVRAHRPEILVIDTIDSLSQADTFPPRLGRFLTALNAMLRGQGVATLLTAETPTLLGGEPHPPVPDVSALVDNIVLLRYVERQHRLHRRLSILKVRESEHDTRIREFTISAEGIRLAAANGDRRAPAREEEPDPRAHPRHQEE
jgi:circadian clock protein KaiC